MKTKTFFDLAQAERYLRGSIIRYKTMPYTITAVGRGSEKGKFVVELCPLGSGRADRVVNINDPDIDMNPVPLGYLNYTGDSVHLASRAFRIPAREWKVGLTSGTLKLMSLTKDDVQLSKGTIINSLALSNTILGNYPKYTSALEASSTPSISGMAFNRRFAIKKGLIYHLLHRTPVGRYKADNGEATLDKPFEFLKESLDRAMQT